MSKKTASAMRLLVAGIIFSLSIPSLSTAKTTSPDFVELAKKLKPTVVNIRTAKVIKPRSNLQRPRMQSPFDNFFEDFFGQFNGQMPQQRPRREQSLGTGFVISPDGYILTNNHVVSGADEVMVKLSDGREIKGEIKGADEKLDLALIKVSDKETFHAAELGDKSQLMALAFASRYRPLSVLAGVSVATLIVHAGSVLLGSAFALAHTTQLPQPSATVTLDPELEDAWGLPAIRTTFTEHPNDRQLSQYFLERCLELLRPGGLLFLSTGDAASPWARVCGRHWQLMTPPQHLFFHTGRSVQALAGQAGLELVEVSRPGRHVNLGLLALKARESTRRGTQRLRQCVETMPKTFLSFSGSTGPSTQILPQVFLTLHPGRAFWMFETRTSSHRLRTGGDLRAISEYLIRYISDQASAIHAPRVSLQIYGLHG